MSTHKTIGNFINGEWSTGSLKTTQNINPATEQSIGEVVVSTKAEVEDWKTRDPITTFVQRLQAQGLLSDADVATIEREVAREIGEAVAFAEAGAWEPVEDLARFVYSERRTE